MLTVTYLLFVLRVQFWSGELSFKDFLMVWGRLWFLVFSASTKFWFIFPCCSEAFGFLPASLDQTKNHKNFMIFCFCLMQTGDLEYEEAEIDSRIDSMLTRS